MVIEIKDVSLGMVGRKKQAYNFKALGMKLQLMFDKMGHLNVTGTFNFNGDATKEQINSAMSICKEWWVDKVKNNRNIFYMGERDWNRCTYKTKIRNVEYQFYAVITEKEFNKMIWDLDDVYFPVMRYRISQLGLSFKEKKTNSPNGKCGGLSKSITPCSLEPDTTGL